MSDGGNDRGGRRKDDRRENYCDDEDAREKREFRRDLSKKMSYIWPKCISVRHGKVTAARENRQRREYLI